MNNINVKQSARSADTPLVYLNIQVIDDNSYVLEFTKINSYYRRLKI